MPSPLTPQSPGSMVLLPPEVGPELSPRKSLRVTESLYRRIKGSTRPDVVALTHPKNCHPEAAESPAKRATPNEGSLHLSLKRHGQCEAPGAMRVLLNPHHFQAVTVCRNILIVLSGAQCTLRPENL
jgi:hypothetical protein